MCRWRPFPVVPEFRIILPGSSSPAYLQGDEPEVRFVDIASEAPPPVRSQA